MVLHATCNAPLHGPSLIQSQSHEDLAGLGSPQLAAGVIVGCVLQRLSEQELYHIVKILPCAINFNDDCFAWRQSNSSCAFTGAIA